jgi:DNA-binding NarL/FixJ family response regulator
MKTIYKYLSNLVNPVQQSVLLVYYGPKENSRQFIPKLSIHFNLPWKIIECNNWTDVEYAIKKNPQTLIIHHSNILNKEKSVAEFLLKFKLVTKLVNKKSPIRLAVLIEQNTPLSIINELFGSGYVKNIVPSVTDFGMISYIASIRAILQQLYYCPQEILNSLTLYPTVINPVHKTVPVNLTPRQHEIAVLISINGFGNKQIGKILGISESSVKSHLSKIFKKYNVSNRLQLTSTLLRQK